MLNFNPVVLNGIHTRLEPLQEEHREVLKELAQDERISTYSPALKIKFDAWFNKALKYYPHSPQIAFVVRDQRNQSIIGSTRYYEINPEHSRLSIGYTWYIPEVWGSNVNPACKLLLLTHAFEVLKINRVEFFVDSRNDRSRAALKKLGATEEGVLRQHIILEDGYVRDTVVLSILKSEWASVKLLLESRLS